MARLLNPTDQEAYFQAWNRYYEQALSQYDIHYPIVTYRAHVQATLQCLADARQLRIHRQSGSMEDDLFHFQSTLILNSHGTMVAQFVESHSQYMVQYTIPESNGIVEIYLLVPPEPMPDFPEFWDEHERPIDFTGHGTGVMTLHVHVEDLWDEFHSERKKLMASMAK